MNPSRRGALDTTALMWIISLAILTIIFALLAYFRADDARLTREGDPEVPGRSPNLSLSHTRGQIDGMRTDIEGIEAQIADKKSFIQSLDYRLNGLGAYFHSDASGGRWIYGGDQTRDGLAIPGAWQVLRTRIKASSDRLAAWNTMLGSNQAQRFDDIETVTRSFQDRQQAVLGNAAESRARFESDREALSIQSDRIRTERVAAEALARDNMNTRLTRKTQLDQEIRELLELRLEWMTSLVADANVLRVDLNNRYLIIDRGTANGILPGLRFEVFTYDKGRYVTKGLVEVTELGTHIATCRILEQVDARHLPFHAGDQVGNPVFDPNDPKVFVLAGEFKRYNRSDLERFIVAAGGQVRPSLMPGIDFLVAGDRSDGQQDAAREYAVVAMTEETLVRFLNPQFSP